MLTIHILFLKNLSKLYLAKLALNSTFSVFFNLCRQFLIPYRVQTVHKGYFPTVFNTDGIEEEYSFTISKQQKRRSKSKIFPEQNKNSGSVRLLAWAIAYF